MARKLTDEQFDKFIEFLGIELLPYQKILLREMLEKEAPLVCVMPRHLYYDGLLAMAEVLYGTIKAEIELENDSLLR